MMEWTEKAAHAMELIAEGAAHADRSALAMKYLADAEDALTDAIAELNVQIQHDAD